MNFKSWLHAIKNHKKQIAFSLFFLAIAITSYSLSGDYVTDHAASVVSPDLILDHFGPYNLSFIFIWFFVAVITIYFLYPILIKPNELHYFISMFSFFLIVRSFFIMFTRLRVPYDAILPLFPKALEWFVFTNALFFSGHTGIPFLGFLILRKHNKKLGYFMLASSVILGITVLLMHAHYSIDVFSAYFITYGVYKIGNYYFKR